MSGKVYEAVIPLGTKKAMLLAFEGIIVHKLKVLDSQYRRAFPLNKQSITLLLELPEGVFKEFIESRLEITLKEWHAPSVPENKRNKVLPIVVSGGHEGIRPLATSGLQGEFEQLFAELFTNLAIADSFNASCLWRSLTNNIWYFLGKDYQVNTYNAELLERSPKIAYTYRAAGDLVAALRGTGNYLDWHCGEDPGRVVREVADGLSVHGWYSMPTKGIKDAPSV